MVWCGVVICLDAVSLVHGGQFVDFLEVTAGLLKQSHNLLFGLLNSLDLYRSESVTTDHEIMNIVIPRMCC